MVVRYAAQYIRMSTDKQDLSPSVQKDAIAAYAASRGMEIVVSYEDEGRSGVRLKNRPSLMKLLADVTEPHRFSTVLVYDVSRWGRFQDTDAAAYYEYHCRLHEVEVIYVAELFGSVVNPIAALLKSMKRSMAAEYSRELADKCRAGQHVVVTRGYQMGPLPPLGYRRSSVSADGQRRVTLEPRQRKLAATDRVQWILAGEDEVALVRRICDMYSRTRFSFADIAHVGVIEGWRDHEGRRLSAQSVAVLTRNEALIGNFVWGRGKNYKGMTQRAPSRNEGCVPRIVDDGTWQRMRRRDAIEVCKHMSDDEVVDHMKLAFERTPLLTTRDLRVQGVPGRHTLRKRIGSWSELVRRAGRDPTALHKELFDRMVSRKRFARTFGKALAERLFEAGLTVVYDARLSVLNFTRLRMRLRLLWPTEGEMGESWRIRVDQIKRDVDLDLVVRMRDESSPLDFFIVEPADLVTRFPRWLTDPVPVELARFWFATPQSLVRRIEEISH